MTDNEKTTERQNENELAVRPVGKLVAKFAIPSVVSLTVTALYNIVDQIFIGNKIGYLGNGATNVVFPITAIAHGLAMLAGRVCAIGVSSFITQAEIVILTAVMNNVLVKYGAMSKYGEDIPMTAIGIVMKVNSVLTNIIAGIAIGGQPIISFNYGAGQFERVKKTFKILTVSAVVVSGLAFLCFRLIPETISGIFGNENELYTEFAVKGFRIYLMCVILIAFTNVAGVFIQSIGKPVKSSVLSLSRQLQKPLNKKRRFFNISQTIPNYFANILILKYG